MKPFFFNPNYSQYALFASPRSWINQLVIDIKRAQKYVYIETYRLNNDWVGYALCEALKEVAGKGVEVRLIVDSWGTSHSLLFEDMQNHGIHVLFFKKFVFSFSLFAKNHERNHQKIVVIDDMISYIGSANFSQYSVNWRESILRIDGDIASRFKRVFLDAFKRNQRILRRNLPDRQYFKTIHHQEFSIIREAPSIIHQRTRKFFGNLIDNAKESLTIITPYFLPGKMIRSKLVRAAKRGVHVQVIVPKSSDVKFADYLRDMYLGSLFRNNVEILFYARSNIHAKLTLVDDALFTIGSSNFDYRSFRYMYEITLSAKNKAICGIIGEFIQDTVKICVPFDYLKWSLRSPIQKIIGFLLFPIRKLL